MGSPSDWPIDGLWPNPDNPRRNITGYPDFEGLVASVKSQGIIQPLLINNEGMILAGHRRFEAAKLAGLARVPVRVLADHLNQGLIPLIENLQRSDLAVLEVAEYLRQYSREHDATLVEISEVTGISNSTIRKYLKLADAPVELKERVERDEIPLNAAFELLRHDDEFIREVVKTPKLTKEIVRERSGISARKPQLAQPPTSCPKETVPHLQYAVNAIEQLRAASPSEAFSVRYQRWLNILRDDLEDARDTPHIKSTFRGAIDAFQRQPRKVLELK